MVIMGEQYQRTFVGGMDLLSKDTDIDPTGYQYLINARNRYGFLEAIPKSVDITYNLNGNIQAIYAVGNIWLAFCSGKAYYMLIDSTSWLPVPNLQLDPFVPYIYAVAVPGSTNNYLRQAFPTSTSNPNPNAGGGVILNSTPEFAFSGTPAGVICQDGENQPWLITYDNVNNNATARPLGTYDSWNSQSNAANAQEYVPIGRQMMYLAPILYVAAPDGFTIYRSVSGSPLNFMVNIDTDGNKLSSEALGGAASVSFAVDFDTINCIIPSTSEASTFLVCTSRFVYGMQPDFTSTIFGEPTFTKAFQVEAGVVNQFSVTDSNGDTPFIDFEGIKFFNATQQLKFEGDNDPFSKNISKVLVNVTQGICAATVFDNYNLFGINTNLGYVMAVYDNTLGKWVGFDINNATISGIKMFAQTVTASKHELSCCTQDNKIHLFYQDPDDKRECGTAVLRAFVSGGYSAYGTFVPNSLRAEHALRYCKVAITNGKQDGDITMIESVDEERGQLMKKEVDGIVSAIAYPVFPPVIPASKDRVKNLIFPLDRGERGYKITPTIVWTSDLLLNVFEISSEDAVTENSQQQQAAGVTPP